MTETRGQLVLEATLEALRAVRHPRFFRSERGYRGRFYCALQEALDKRKVFQGDLILEMEYQKGSRHGLTQRPDIILHVPAEEARASVQENNVAVFALKRRASPDQACDEFRKLDEMCKNLHSDDHHIACYAGPFEQRLHAFAVKCESGKVRIRHAWWQGGPVQERAQ